MDYNQKEPSENRLRDTINTEKHIVYEVSNSLHILDLCTLNSFTHPKQVTPSETDNSCTRDMEENSVTSGPIIRENVIHIGVHLDQIATTRSNRNITTEGHIQRASVTESYHSEETSSNDKTTQKVKRPRDLSESQHFQLALHRLKGARGSLWQRTLKRTSREMLTN